MVDYLTLMALSPLSPRNSIPNNEGLMTNFVLYQSSYGRAGHDKRSLDRRRTLPRLARVLRSFP